MDAYIIDWLNLLARWLHVIAGIAWIGSSFYFIWLDDKLQAPADTEDQKKGVGGEVWSVHGGGFYHAQKYRVAPPVMPSTLHWFKWEAYTTWLSGMFLRKSGTRQISHKRATLLRLVARSLISVSSIRLRRAETSSLSLASTSSRRSGRCRGSPRARARHPDRAARR